MPKLEARNEKDGTTVLVAVGDGIHMARDVNEFGVEIGVIMVETPPELPVGPERLNSAIELVSEFLDKERAADDSPCLVSDKRGLLFEYNFVAVNGGVGLTVPMPLIDDLVKSSGDDETIVLACLFATRAILMLEGKCECAECVSRKLMAKDVEPIVKFPRVDTEH